MKKITSTLAITFTFSAILLCGCGNNVSSFEKQITSGNYNKAIEIYQNNIIGNSPLENECKSYLDNYLGENWTKYAEGKIDATEFENIYTTLDKVNIQLSIMPDLESIHAQFISVKESKENYSNAEEFVEEGKLTDAIILYSAVIPTDTENYERAQDAKNAATVSYENEIIAKAEQLISSELYDEADTLIYEAENIVGKTDNLEDTLSNLHTQQYENAIRTAYNNNDFIDVIKLYNESKSNSHVTISSEMTNQYSFAASNYINNVCARAETAFGDNKDYSAAIDILKSALSEVTGDKEIRNKIEEKIDEYKEFTPIFLTSMEYIQKSDFILIGSDDKETTSDVNSNHYNHTTIIYPTGGEYEWEYPGNDNDPLTGCITYNINLQYSSLSGIIYRPYKSLSAPS